MLHSEKALTHARVSSLKIGIPRADNREKFTEAFETLGITTKNVRRDQSSLPTNNSDVTTTPAAIGGGHEPFFGQAPSSNTSNSTFNNNVPLAPPVRDISISLATVQGRSLVEALVEGTAPRSTLIEKNAALGVTFPLLHSLRMSLSNFDDESCVGDLSLATFPRLHVLKFTTCGGLTSDKLIGISFAAVLRTLALCDCRDLTSLDFLRPHDASSKKNHETTSTSPTSTGLTSFDGDDVVAAMPLLEELNLSGSHVVDILGLRHACPALRTLRLDRCRYLRSLVGVGTKPYLTVLSASCAIDLRSLAGLEGCPKLEYLHITGTPIVSGDTPLLSPPLRRFLKHLDLADSRLSSVGRLGECFPYLEVLCVDRCTHLRSLEDIGAAPRLTQLSASRSALESLKGLEQCPSLQSINLSNCSDFVSMKGLCGATHIHLQKINISHSKVSPVFFGEVLACPALAVLDLRGCVPSESHDALPQIVASAQADDESLKKEMNHAPALEHESVLPSATLHLSTHSTRLLWGLAKSAAAAGVRRRWTFEVYDQAKAAPRWDLLAAANVMLPFVDALVFLRGCDASMADLAGVFPRVERLCMAGHTPRTALEGLWRFERLVRFEARDCTTLTSLEGISPPPADTLLQQQPDADTRSMNTNGIADSPLRHLEVPGAAITDLTGLERCPLLEFLNIATCPNLLSLKGLGRKPHLGALIASMSALETLEGLEECLNLRRVDVRESATLTTRTRIRRMFPQALIPSDGGDSSGGSVLLESLSFPLHGLRNATELTHLSAAGTLCRDLSGIEACDRLVDLDLGLCALLRAIDGLGSPKLALSHLNLFATAIRSVSLLGTLCPNLEQLSLAKCEQLESLTGLAPCARLRALNISQCPLLTSFEGIGRHDGLRRIDALDAGLMSLRGLEQSGAGLEWLNLRHCRRLQTLAGLPQSTIVATSGRRRPDPAPVAAHLRPRLSVIAAGSGLRADGLSSARQCGTLWRLDVSRCEQLTSLDVLLYDCGIAEPSLPPPLPPFFDRIDASYSGLTTIPTEFMASAKMPIIVVDHCQKLHNEKKNNASSNCVLQ